MVLTQDKKIRSYKDLRVWQKSIDVVVEIYRLTKTFPRSEQYALTSQIQRAVVSIPANIAEGYGRNTEKEYIHFLRIAGGSLAEVETLLTIAGKLSYMTREECSKIEEQLSEVARMLYALRRSISRSNA